MVALSLALFLAFAASADTATAATISFVHSLDETGTTHFEAFDMDGELPYEGFNPPDFGWLVPEFDDDLGTVEALFLSIDAEVTLSGFAHGDPFLMHWDFLNLHASALAFADCDDPCAFLTVTPIVGEVASFAYTNSDPQFDWHIGYAPDSHVHRTLRTALDIEMRFVGTATATYLYEPAAVAEPASIVLIASGFAGSALTRHVKRRRK